MIVIFPPFSIITYGVILYVSLISPTAAISFPFEEKPMTNAAPVKPESFKKLRLLIGDVCCIVKDFEESFYLVSCSSAPHRLLCHSLIRSEFCSANLLQYK